MDELLVRIETTLQKYKMLTPGERILVACSGGADSVGLLHILRELAPRFKIRLSLVHFDHALRRDSRKDLKFVERMAKGLRIPFYGGRRKPKSLARGGNLSPEEAAREIRYEFFRQVSRRTRIRKIALAHHRDDQAETVLMRLVQGTGLRGLQGIRPVARRKSLVLIRPLIEVSRSEIRKFLRGRSISYREDVTNRSRRFLRNRIRNRLLPLLEKEFNPKMRALLCRLAETSVRESAGLDDWAERHTKDYFIQRRNSTIWLDRERFLAFPDALQFRILGRAIRLLESRSGLDFESWKRIEEGFRKGRYRTNLPQNLDLNLTSKKLSISKA